MDVISDKIDASLQLALQLPTEELEKSGSLSAGYEKESQSWELILRLADLAAGFSPGKFSGIERWLCHGTCPRGCDRGAGGAG